MKRQRVLKVVLVIVGLLFCAGVYPLIGSLLHPADSDTGDTMMLTLYFALGIFLLIAARNPSAHRSLIAFAAWSSFSHAVTMSIQGLEIASQREGFLLGSGCTRYHRRCVDRAGSSQATSRESLCCGRVGLGAREPKD